jgi:hypothetical protein
MSPGPAGAVASFLDEVRSPARPLRVGAARAVALIFALDATASRERAWDRACDVQAAMFVEAERLGGLDVQLPTTAASASAAPAAGSRARPS